MTIEKMAIMDIDDISEETEDRLLDRAAHEDSIACMEVEEGFILNLQEMPGGWNCDTGMPDLDEAFRRARKKGCSWVFFRE